MIKISETEYGLPQTLLSMKDMYDIKMVTTERWHPVGSPLDLKKAEEVILNFYS